MRFQFIEDHPLDAGLSCDGQAQGTARDDGEARDGAPLRERAAR
jgi:hypothetical protein